MTAAFDGPGKYDDLTTLVREGANARAVLVIVLGGDKGDGFSIQGDLATLLAVPDLLEQVAGSVRTLQSGRPRQ
jgi:hypothetical protein